MKRPPIHDTSWQRPPTIRGPGHRIPRVGMTCQGRKRLPAGGDPAVPPRWVAPGQRLTENAPLIPTMMWRDPIGSPWGFLLPENPKMSHKMVAMRHNMQHGDVGSARFACFLRMHPLPFGFQAVFTRPDQGTPADASV